MPQPQEKHVNDTYVDQEVEHEYWTLRWIKWMMCSTCQFRIYDNIGECSICLQSYIHIKINSMYWVFVTVLSMCYCIEYVLRYWVCVTLLSMCYVIEYVLRYWLCVMVLSMCYGIEYVLRYWVCVTVLSMCYGIEYVLRYWVCGMVLSMCYGIE